MDNYINLGLEACGVGVLTLIFGHVIFYLGVEKNKKNDIKKYFNNLSTTLFLIGFLLHIFLEIVGLNKWYCDKRCIISVKN